MLWHVLWQLEVDIKHVSQPAAHGQRIAAAGACTANRHPQSFSTESFCMGRAKPVSWQLLDQPTLHRSIHHFRAPVLTVQATVWPREHLCHGECSRKRRSVCVARNRPDDGRPTVVPKSCHGCPKVFPGSARVSPKVVPPSGHGRARGR